MTTIEKLLTQIISIPAIQEALNNLEQTIIDAQQAADNANQAAVVAQAVSIQQANDSSLIQSYVSLPSGQLLVASSTGVVTISTHNRVYANQGLNPTVSVQGGNISTGAAPDSVVRVYYHDPDRQGGNVTYQWTVDPQEPVAQGGDVHSVGAVSIPQTGTQSGRGVRPAGYIEP